MTRAPHRWFLGAANAVTLARLPLAALLWVDPARPPWILTVIAAAALTDIVDGAFARWLRRWHYARFHAPVPIAESARLGAWLDPLCDKVFVVSTVVAVAVAFETPLWLAGTLAAREILVLPLVLAYHAVPGPWRGRVDFTAGSPGKATTVLQFAALGLGILRHDAFAAVAIAAGLLGVFSVAYYVRKAFRSAPATTREAP